MRGKVSKLRHGQCHAHGHGFSRKRLRSDGTFPLSKLPVLSCMSKLKAERTVISEALNCQPSGKPAINLSGFPGSWFSCYRPQKILLCSLQQQLVPDANGVLGYPSIKYKSLTFLEFFSPCRWKEVILDICDPCFTVAELDAPIAQWGTGPLFPHSVL